MLKTYHFDFPALSDDEFLEVLEWWRKGIALVHGVPQELLIDKFTQKGVKDGNQDNDGIELEGSTQEANRHTGR